MEAAVYNTSGIEIGKISLPTDIFGVKWNPDLVHQVVVSMQGNARAMTAHTKTRGEVRGGGKKPWRQKGTGRARHGSTRSPIWVGGGVAHGPRNDKDYSRKINKKMRLRALLSALSKKYQDGNVLFVEDLKMKEAKTREAKQIISQVSKIKGFGGITRRSNASLLVTPTSDVSVKRAFKNFSNMMVSEAINLNPVSVLSYKFLVVSRPAESFEKIISRK